MDIRVQISDSDNELKYKVEREVNKQVEKFVSDKLKDIDIETLIIKRIEYLVNVSKYVSDNVVRNLVQQKIAREISSIIIKQE